MSVQKTVPRRGVTLAHGHFVAREPIMACKAGCAWPSGSMVALHAPGLSDCLVPKCTFGYDLMVHVGLLRYQHHRQRTEIQVALQQDHGITLSAGTVSNLAKRFLEYLLALHVARTPNLAAALQRDGGYYIHADATCEDGQGTLFAVMAGWRPWVLAAAKLPTEHADAIKPVLKKVVAGFGVPLAIVRDLGPAIIQASIAVAAEQDTPVRLLSCHSHFLKDVGKDLLTTHHRQLYQLFRDAAILKDLRSLTRKLGRALGEDVNAAREEVKTWQRDIKTGHQIPRGRAGLAVVRSIAQWILDHAADGEGLRFPFDRPYLTLYSRCRRGLRAIDAFLRASPDDANVRRSLMRLRDILLRVNADPSFETVAKHMGRRIRLFDRLRRALRLRGKEADGGEIAIASATSTAQAEELRNIYEAVENLALELLLEIPERGPAEDEREAIRLILDHIARHHDSLWDHAVLVRDENGEQLRTIARTNNLIELLFRSLKQTERRRSGRKVLSKDLEFLPPEALLVHNLSCPDYLEILCGSIEGLPSAFAMLDHVRRKANREGKPLTRSDASADRGPETASLPSADRTIVRSQAMQTRIDAAAKSRAPRSYLAAQ